MMGPDLAVADLRGQLASFRPLLALSMVMTSSRDENEILRLATTTVPALGNCRTVGVYLDDDWWVAGSGGRPRQADELELQLADLNGAGGPLDLGTDRWVWAYPLAGLELSVGYHIVSAASEPAEHHRFLLSVLVQQAAAALVNARLYARERQVNRALEESNAAVERSMAALQRSMAIHDRFTAVASSGDGHDGIARAAHELTGYPVAIEDRYGNLISWAGPDQPEPYPKPPATTRDQTLAKALSSGRPIRDRDRLIAVAHPGQDVLGVIALVDPEATAGETELVALEHANTVLQLELAHRRALAEAELRLRRDLVEELLAGTDPDSAKDRARALDYDLSRPHRVVVVANLNRKIDHERFFHAVRRAVRSARVGSMLVAKAGGVAVLADSDQDWVKFHASVTAELGSRGGCRVGVGAPCGEPPDFPRSYGQAQLALKVQVATGGPDQVTVFEQLGIYQLLSEHADIGSVESFVHRWIGGLLEYDAAKNGQLVETLATYLECGGNYDATAKALVLHRSTLRYRLSRIREVSGLELNEPDTRFNLQLATRAWTTIHAMQMSL
jgi:DNA-binding PucR family transcriptional regulator